MWPVDGVTLPKLGYTKGLSCFCLSWWELTWREDYALRNKGRFVATASMEKRLWVPSLVKDGWILHSHLSEPGSSSFFCQTFEMSIGRLCESLRQRHASTLHIDSGLRVIVEQKPSVISSHTEFGGKFYLVGNHCGVEHDHLQTKKSQTLGVTLLKLEIWGWIEGPVLENTGCSYREPELDSQNPHEAHSYI